MKILYFVFVILLFVVFAGNASAAMDSGKYWAGRNLEVADEANLPWAPEPVDVVITIVRFLLSFLGLVTVVFIIYGGYKWMTDRGSGKGIDEAKKIIQSAVIGLVLILSAYIISEWVIKTIYDKVSK